MTEMVPFNYREDRVLRTLVIDGEPYVLALDVCRELGYANPSDALSRHVDPADVQYRTLAIYEGSRTVSRERPVVNEAGFYDLVMGSDMPDAKDFKRWVTHTVLPALRKTGTYTLPGREKPIELKLAQYAEASRRRDQRELAKQGLYRMPDGEIRQLPTVVPAEDVIEAKVRKTVAEIQRKADRAGDSPHEPRSEFLERNKPFQQGIGER